MIDFILGIVTGGLLAAAYYHFRGETPAKALSDFSNLEQRIKLMMEEAMAILAAAVEAAKAQAVDDYKANQPVAPDPVEVAAQQETADAEKVSAFADQISAPRTDG